MSATIPCSLRETAEGFVLGNANMQLLLDSERGLPSRFFDIAHKFEWSAIHGRLEIYDGLADRHYNTAEHCAETAVEIEEGENPAVTFCRRFAGAEWQLRERFRAEEDAVHWEIELLLDEGAVERSIAVRQLVPWPTMPWGWRVWSANFNFPSYTHNVAGLHLEYGDVCFGTVIPATTVYDPAKGVGLAIAKPFGLPVPRLTFCFSDYRSDGVTVQHDLLGLRKGNPLTVAIMLRFHKGCFRPTLAWLLEKYPDYFLPQSPGVHEIEGGSTFGPPQLTEADAATLAEAGIKWYEIHHGMPYFGEYCPEFDGWGDGSRGGKDFQVAGRPATFIDGKPTTYEVINDCGKLLARHGIGSLLYFQVAGDAQLPIMAEKFPESLARDEHGGYFPSCPDSVLINSDPSLPFGRDMERQISVLLDRYPDISGVFVDQACYNATDCAHDDGLTMYKNRPAYRLRFCFDKHLPDLCRRLRAAGKFIYSNGPYDIELQRNFDGNMAESTSTVMGTMRYMHIAKPLLVFRYYKDELDVEEMFQQCLLAGASWAAWQPTTHSWFVREDLTAAQKGIFACYVPLCRRLLGRTILLEPNPVHFPAGRGAVYAGDGVEVTVGNDRHAFLDWEIFRGRDGNILIALVSRRKSCRDAGGFTRDLRINLRIEDASRVSRACVVGVDHSDELPVEMELMEEALALTVPRHGAASLVTIELDTPRTAL